MVQNTLPSNKKKINWTRGLKDISQKVYFERDLTLPHSCHVMKIVGGKGIF